MSIAATLPTYLPYVRRFARTLTSSQAFGDQYALAALEAAAANPGAVGEDPDGSVWMYRRLLEIWLDNGAPSSQDANQEGDAGSRAAGRHVDGISPLPRAAFLLRWMEGFSVERIARILECPVARVHALTEQAGFEIAEQITTDVLIIEDEPIIAMDIESMVIELGHRVVGVARTRAEAALVTREHAPGLILADLHLDDNSSGLDAVNDILDRYSVPVVFITAYPERLQTDARPRPTLLISKPYRSETIKSAISQVLFFDAKAHREQREEPRS
jgi:CheY-like chemotaxis protein/DNA-directed RNA polymerase specialized sigma24 family protein